MALSKPSSPDPVYTPGTARGAKLAALLVDEGTSLVRKIFEHEVQNMNPPSLREQLKKHKRYLCGLRYLNPGQRKTLYPPSDDVPDTAQGFDISLLELLLKELCGSAPYSGPRNRLRQYRNNNYGHISSTDMSEGDFDKLWDELTEILVALGGDRDKISDRLNCSIDPEQEKEYFTLLEKLFKEDMEVRHFLCTLKKGQDSLKKGQDRLTEGQDSLKEGQDSLKEGQDGLKEGQDSLKKGQDSLKEGQNSLKEGQDDLKEGQDGLKEGQEVLKTLILERVLGTSTGPHAESSCQTDQGHAGLPDGVDDVIACLKDLYATEYAHVRPLPWCEDLNLHLGEVYTNLQLQYRDGRGHFKDTDTIVSLADIYNTGKGVSHANAHANVSSAVRKIRVEGDPGIGKSCSCQKLADDWSCGKLERFKFVLFLEMRHLAGKVKEAIFEQLLPKDTKVNPDQLWSYIQGNQDDVLFILDGLDELSQAAREVTDVVGLIQGKILRNCHVLVTSRPYHCVKDLEKCHQYYKIVGYTEENSEEFIHKYFCESPESGLELVEQLQRNSSLSEIVVNPLNNVLICVVWEENSEKLPSRKAELYEMIVYSVANRFRTRMELPMEGDKLPPDIEEALRGLGKLSWEGLEQDQLQFNIDEIKKKYGTTADNMLNMGLLTRDYSFSRIKRTCYCAFLHKTFQEYMAARYICGLVMDESSREEGMKCVCRLFGLSDATVVNRELLLSCYRKYREVRNTLLMTLGENSRPLFERFTEELQKAQTDEDRELLSFLCIMWLGTSCEGGTMAEIVAPCLSQHVTNNAGGLSDSVYTEVTNRLLELIEMMKTQDPDRHPSPIGAQPLSRSMDENTGRLRVYRFDHANWCVGLAHVLRFQKKLPAGHGCIQHLTINCDRVIAAQQDKLGALENALSDYGAMRSVTLHDVGP